jgi:hypothetical protein
VTTQSVTVVNHGGTADTPRPDAAVVLWIGQVAPANAIASDLWQTADAGRLRMRAAIGQWLDTSQPPFDITAMRPRYVATLDVPTFTQMQSFALDQDTNEYYVSQTEDWNGGDPTLHIYRFSAEGELLDDVVLINGGHGGQIALEKSAGQVYLWFRWQQSDPPRPVRWQYHPSTYKAIVNVDDPEVEEVTGLIDGENWFAIDQQNGLIATQSISGLDQIYRLRRLSDVLAHVDDALATVTIPNFTATYGAWQGMATCDGYLYVLWGYGGYTDTQTDSPPRITRLSWSTGDLVVMDVSELAFGTSEPEGLCIVRDRTGTAALLMGYVNFGGGLRTNMLYAFQPPGYLDDLASPMMRYLSRVRVESDVVTVTPTANTPTSAPVTFRRPFIRPPTVVVSPLTTGPGTVVTGTSVSDITTTGFNVWLTRINSTATTVQWIAADTRTGPP